MCIGPCIILIMKNNIQLDATYYIIMLMLGSICFGHHYAHHQELNTIALVTTLAVWFSSCCTTNREPDSLCGNQRYSRELLMMGVMVPETC